MNGLKIILRPFEWGLRRPLTGCAGRASPAVGAPTSTPVSGWVQIGVGTMMRC